MENWKAEQAAPRIVSGTLIASIPLHDWVALKQGDQETAKELMDGWKAEQAEKNSTTLAEKKVKEAKTMSKSAIKRGDSNSDVDLSNIVDSGSTSGTRSRKRRC